MRSTLPGTGTRRQPAPFRNRDPFEGRDRPPGRLIETAAAGTGTATLAADRALAGVHHTSGGPC